MNNRKYIGMDVHQASISIAVSDAAGKVLMECIIETKAATVLEFIPGLRGSLWVTFEEGTSAAWLYERAPHGMCSTPKDQISAELLAFVRSAAAYVLESRTLRTCGADRKIC